MDTYPYMKLSVVRNLAEGLDSLQDCFEPAQCLYGIEEKIEFRVDTLKHKLAEEWMSATPRRSYGSKRSFLKS
jgi:hypothetical protein